ncbi:hypothetical protein M413DRAFT_447977 [Hebeloma cylindrosporum]|uniref:Small nuclear ribonucleoprotein Prp3 C-terminal domain-containing protein n=1 Tax=Hebeloma cylindrosporum TaxID=76867 RepID=A0A0C3C1U9_HEBCY|nr:hypothetical protein M413DRAFT_447977 [Hebeloma cylindrosporum h7]
MKEDVFKQQLEELHLIQCSLLPTECIVFLDSGSWTQAITKYAEDPYSTLLLPDSPASFLLRVEGSKIWFEITLAPVGDNKFGISKPSVSVKGEDITRADQERWQKIVVEGFEDIADSEFPIYALVALHLLPKIHEEIDLLALADSKIGQMTSENTLHEQSCIFHVLFTSHHLISPNKRRSLQQWSSSLSLSGFAKVGYPGVIYAQGERSRIEEFVDNVKAMQWLALKVRFVEPLDTDLHNKSVSEPTGEARKWKEFQKVGEVVEEMRKLGREEYVVEMGIGSAGINAT